MEREKGEEAESEVEATKEGHEVATEGFDLMDLPLSFTGARTSKTSANDEDEDRQALPAVGSIRTGGRKSKRTKRPSGSNSVLRGPKAPDDDRQPSEGPNSVFPPAVAGEKRDSLNSIELPGGGATWRASRVSRQAPESVALDIRPVMSEAPASRMVTTFSENRSLLAAHSTAASSPPRSKTMMEAMFHCISGSHVSLDMSMPMGTELGTCLLAQNLSLLQLKPSWYHDLCMSLSKEGMRVIKVGHNGKPYERRLFVQSKNDHQVLEIRGGLIGSRIPISDLKNAVQGVASFELAHFCRVANGDYNSMHQRAIVLTTPHRAFSLLFATVEDAETLGRVLCYMHRLCRGEDPIMGPQDPVTLAFLNPPALGHAKVLYHEDALYEGHFKNGMRHGNGKLTLADGTVCRCHWEKDEMHGHGEQYWPDDSCYEGNFVRGDMCGEGCMTWSDGSKYKGQFARGHANGQGTLFRSDGARYEGDFVGGDMCGSGTMSWHEEDCTYIGEFYANKRHGRGVMTWMHGPHKRYEGQWMHGHQHGRGMVTTTDGTVHTANFHNGIIISMDHHALPKSQQVQIDNED